jgi:hypothetical protein
MDIELIIGLLILLTFPLIVKVFITRQRSAIKQMQGLWRILACVPLIAVAAAVVVSIIGLVQGSNLWPIWLFIIVPPALFI